MKQLLLFIVVWIYPIIGFCNLEPYFQLLNKEDGLPSHTIYSIEEDGFGRILLGTEKGLYRYNGIQFKELMCKENYSKSIANLRKINPHSFLCHNFNGQLFLLEYDVLKPLLLPDLPAEINNIRVQGDSLLVISLKRAVLYNWRKKKRLKIFSSKEPAGHIFTAQFVPSGIAISYSDGTFYDGSSTRHLKHNMCYDIEVIENKLLLTPIYSLNETPLILDKNRTKTLCKLPFQDHPRLYSTTKIAHFYYLCSQSGIVQIDSKGNLSHWFKEYQTTKIIQDKRGNFWVSTLNQGLLYIPNINTVTVSTKPTISVNLSDKQLLFGGNSMGDVDCFDSQGTYLRTFKPKLSLTEASFIEIDNRVLRTPTSVFDIQTGIQLNKQFEYIKHYTKDEQGNFYFAKTYGLIKLDKRFIKQPGSEYGIDERSNLFYYKSIRTKDVVFTDATTLVAACIDGIYYWKNNREHRLLFHNQPIVATHLFAFKNKLYISTHKFGVLVYENFLFKEQIYPPKKEEFGKVLKTIATEKGVFILTDLNFYYQSKSHKSCVPLKQATGLNDIEINDFVVKESLCYFATDGGILKVSIFEATQEKPNLLINILEINGKHYFNPTFFEIEHGENDLKLAIEPILFKNNKSSEIEYKLNQDGGKSKWISVPISSKYIYFSSLKAGNYVLNIRIKDGIISDPKPIKTFHFTILKPWYLQGTAFLIYAVVFALIISFFWWLRSNFLQRKYLRDLEKQRLKNELSEARLTALRAQMNPHFMYNVLNSIQSLVYTNKHHEASEYLGKFAQLTRLILELSSKENTSLKQEVELLEIYLELEKLRFGDELHYEINIDPQIDTTFSRIPTLLIQPFVENSLKHGLLHKTGTKELLLQFSKKTDGIHVLILDNGIGRVKSGEINARNKEKKASYATSAVLKKLDLLNKQSDNTSIQMRIEDLYNENNEPIGTQVILLIPQSL